MIDFIVSKNVGGKTADLLECKSAMNVLFLYLYLDNLIIITNQKVLCYPTIVTWSASKRTQLNIMITALQDKYE